MPENEDRRSIGTSRAVWWASLLAGLVGGFACFFVVYPVSHGARIGVFPLPAYAWERLELGAWAVFAGPLSLPFLVVDFALGFWFFQKTACWLGTRSARSAGQSAIERRRFGADAFGFTLSHRRGAMVFGCSTFGIRRHLLMLLRRRST